MLLRNVFTKAVWDGRRALLGWTLAIVVLGAIYAGTWPSVNNPQMLQAMDSYPETLKQAFNFDEFATPAGYLSGSVYGLVVGLLVVVLAIAWGTRAVAGDEEAGTLDLVLAHPVGRARLALERFGALTAGMAVVVLALLAAIAALRGPAQLSGIGIGELAATSLQLLLFGVWFAALAFALGASSGRRGVAIGVSAGVAVLAYLANTLLPRVDALSWTRSVSPFHWYLGGKPLVNGLQPGHSLLLLVTAAALVTAGILAFRRRDLGV